MMNEQNDRGVSFSIADANEVLAFLTSVMRGENDEPIATRMKAAELLGKRILAFAEDAEPAVIVDDIRG